MGKEILLDAYLKIRPELQIFSNIPKESTLSFSVLSGVRSMNEAFPLERAQEAYERMISGIEL